MDAAVANVAPVLLLNNAILPQALEKHLKVNAQGLINTDKCLSRLEAENLLGPALVGGVDTKSLMLALGKGASSTVKGVKQSARDGVQRCESNVAIDVV